MSITAMKQALEALIDLTNETIDQDFVNQGIEAITALRTAIEQAEKQEPVAWMWKDGTMTFDADRADGTWTPLYTIPPAAQQEPAPGYCKHCKQYTIEEPLPAAQRKWVGLTEAEINEWDYDVRDVVMDIEKLLREKNA